MRRAGNRCSTNTFGGERHRPRRHLRPSDRQGYDRLDVDGKPRSELLRDFLDREQPDSLKERRKHYSPQAETVGGLGILRTPW